MSAAVTGSRPLGSTYRLQLQGLGFAAATALVDYLGELGVETLYVSPILAAAPGSAHGYDVVDPGRLDPALGTAAGFRALLDALARHGMRLLVDVVPNHMATQPSNAWWWDVLRHGAASEFATTFDIDWSAHSGRVLVPSLAEPRRDVLDRGAATVRTRAGQPEVVLDGQPFPLDPASVPAGAARPTRAELEELLERQHYRPAYWRLGRDEGNYRRFFDVDGLIGVRVEDPDVFESTHRFILELAEDDRIAGLRVDHVDGLADPGGYLARLRAALADHAAPGAVVVIEKILARDETVRRRWPVDGTTGYEFADVAGGLLVDPAGAARIELAGAGLSGDRRTFAELARASKREVLTRAFRSPLRRLSRLVVATLDVELPGHDLSEAEVAEAFIALTVHFDAYRTYMDAGPIDREDRSRVHRAAIAAALELHHEGRRALEVIVGGLLRARSGHGGTVVSDSWLQVARRWQQLSVSVAAKGVEDTATYRFTGLLAQAEVGGDPEHAAIDPAGFYALTGRRGRRYRSSLNATSTHDSKRSEDVRARLSTLSEVSELWNGLVERWHRRHAAAIAVAGGPDGHDELVAYQTLAAMWPVGHPAMSPAQCRRVQDYMVKAAREAKRHSLWTDPDERYERALRTFIHRLSRSPDNRFGSEMERFVGRIGPAAATNSLALCVLKAVCPGVPDIYQGSELWEFSLTDPDNRRPVDFGLRRKLLRGLPPDDAPPAERAAEAGALLSSWVDGRIKLHVLRTLLALRRAHPSLFDRGSYHLLAPEGPLGDHVVAVARRFRGHWVVALVPRLVLGEAGYGRFPTGPRLWAGTSVGLPEGSPVQFADALTGATVGARRGAIEVGRALKILPVSVLSGMA